VPSNGAIYCAQCADHVTDNVIGGGVISVSASSDSLAGASRDNNVISRQAAINTTSHAHAAAAACFRHHSPDGSGSNLAADCSQDSAESSRRRSHVTVSGGARVGNGRGLVSRGSTSRYLEKDDNDDEDSDQSEVYPRLKPRPRHPSHGSTAGPSTSSRRRRPLPTLSPGRLEPMPRPANHQRRRVKPGRAKTRGRVLTTVARSVEGYASDTPAPHGDLNALRCSGYSSDSIDPTTSAISPHSRGHRPRDVVSTAAQTTSNDVINQDGVGTGSGRGQLMSEAVERYLRAAAAWDERHGCSTCSSSSSDSSSDFDYYLDRPLSSASGLGWSSTAAIASPRKCSSGFKQCVVS